jgi:hypothetical protein
VLDSREGIVGTTEKEDEALIGYIKLKDGIIPRHKWPPTLPEHHATQNILCLLRAEV